MEGVDDQKRNLITGQINRKVNNVSEQQHVYVHVLCCLDTAQILRFH